MTTTLPPSATVLPLAAAVDHRFAGRKAAALARLANAGFPVPPGVVVPVHALGSASDGPAEIPAGVASALLELIRPWGDVPLAVRSSGVDEDGARSSYAGMYTSILDVRGEDALLDAVRRCWASAFDGRATAYAGTRDPRLAVLVQPMIAAVAAGVAFTADPVSGERGCVVIDAVPGLADRLAAGTVTPDRWVVREDVRRQSAGPAAIDERQARSVADLSRRVEAEFGVPQDVEWALAGGEVVLLQARPITALPVEPVPVPVDVPDGYWTREASHTPRPWHPFSYCFADLRNPLMRQMADELGLLFDGVDFRDIGGWEYMRVVPLGGKEPPPLPGWLVPVAFRVIPVLRRRVRESVAAMRSDVPGRILRRWTEEWQPDFDTRIRTLRDRPLGDLSDVALREHLDRVLALLGDGATVHVRLHGALAMILGDFAFTCRDLLGWDEARTFTLVSGTSTTSTAPGRALAAVTATAGPAVRSLLARGAPADDVLAADGDFAAAFATYLHEYGCRALAYDLAEPSLEERPEVVLGLVRDQLAGGFDPGAHRAQAERREAAAVAARATVADPDRALFDRALERAVTAYPAREDNEFFTISAPLGLLRRAALELGRRLAGRGQTTAIEDVFFLRQEEARNLLAAGADGTALVRRRRGERAWVLAHPGPASYGRDPGPPPPLRGLPREARRANEAFLWAIDRILAPAARSGGRDRTLTGVAASPGRYTGPVRIIRSEAEFDRLRAGDVLVCPVTSPVWSVLFPSVGALVTDHGGTLSHPAIIAREYAIPAVVATCDATTRLQDGQVVAVDGATGTVEIVG